MEAGRSKVLEAEQVKGTCRAQRGVKALREVYPVSGFLYITCKLCSYGIERYQQRCVTSSKKKTKLPLSTVDPPSSIPGNPQVTSHALEGFGTMSGKTWLQNSSYRRSVYTESQ